MRLIFAALAMLALAACTNGESLPTFTANDAMAAAALAQATGDTAVVGCYQDIAATATAIGVAKSSGNAGLLTAAQTKFALQGQLKDPACSALWLRIIALAGKFTPLGPVIP